MFKVTPNRNMSVRNSSLLRAAGTEELIGDRLTATGPARAHTDLPKGSM